METTPSVPQPEAAVEDLELSEGIFSFSNYQKERGMARLKNKDGELTVVMGAPMKGEFKGGKKATIETPGGKTDVLDVSLLASSPKNTESVALMHLQLDRDTLTGLLAVAAEQGILPKAESKWAPGGKMDQLVRFGLDLDARLGK